MKHIFNFMLLVSAGLIVFGVWMIRKSKR